VFAQLGTTPSGALDVVVATVAVYLAFLLLVRLLGQRALVTASGYDVACVIALGAVIGRTALLATPSLVGGLLALVTLLGMQRLVGAAHRGRLVRRLGGREPVLLVVDGRVQAENLRRTRFGDDELRQLLRLGGVARLDEVAYAVLERNGQVSIVRRTEDLDPWLVADLRTPGARRRPR
jgi:uncharacterized membrane protein YcaP (DUF421 family)